ncbi:uncharacterized protein [Aegilops tauschii subsp. strangulata]|uniref:uncharacterized protein n=1 Tax=Aegilops tauschii subsp. strangulata TaxID=200361 RepID=UPI003CC8A661
MAAINKSLVTLLAKKEGALDVGDFRPINLVHVTIKIFEKVLACRLVVDLPRLVALGLWAAVEIMDLWHSFYFVCQSHGQCEPGDTIINCKGLRQGDPISRMLFILTMEPLQRLFEFATSRGVLVPLAQVGMRKRLPIFADNVALFVKPILMDLAVCQCIFELFGEASGLRINMNKSAALPIRCTKEDITMVCTQLGCPLGSFPIKYLGLPLSLQKQTVAQLQYFVNQMANKLPKWRAALMLKSVRLTLLQSILCATPIHAMMALDLPMNTIAAMNKNQSCNLDMAEAHGGDDGDDVAEDGGDGGEDGTAGVQDDDVDKSSSDFEIDRGD